MDLLNGLHTAQLKQFTDPEGTCSTTTKKKQEEILYILMPRSLMWGNNKLTPWHSSFADRKGFFPKRQNWEVYIHYTVKVKIIQQKIQVVWLMNKQQSRFLIFLFFFSPNQYIVSFYPFLKGIKRTVQILTTEKSEADKQRNKNFTLSMLLYHTLTILYRL